MSDVRHLVLIDLDTAPFDGDVARLCALAHEWSGGRARQCELRIYADWAARPNGTALAWQALGARLIHVPVGTPPAVQLACDVATLPRGMHVLLIGAALRPVEHLLREAEIDATLAAPGATTTAKEIAAERSQSCQRGFSPPRRPGGGRRIALPPVTPALPAVPEPLDHDGSAATLPPDIAAATQALEAIPAADAEDDASAADAIPRAAAEEIAASAADAAPSAAREDSAAPATKIASTEEMPAVSVSAEEMAAASEPEAVVTPPAEPTAPTAAMPADRAITDAQTATREQQERDDAERPPAVPAAESAQPHWEPRARKGTLRPRAHGARQEAKPALPKQLRKSERDPLRRILRGVRLPDAKTKRSEQRQGAMETLRRAMDSIAEWSDLPDAICRDLLDLHGSLARWLQNQGIDAVIKKDFTTAWNALRDFSRDRQPGYVNSLKLVNGPTGRSWLDDARDAWLRLRRAAGLPLNEDAVLAIVDSLQTLEKDAPLRIASAVVAQLRPGICGDRECARIARFTEQTAAAERTVAARECVICGGSSQRRAACAICIRLLYHGKRRLLVVGGDPKARRVLGKTAEDYAIEVRGVAGRGINIAESKAKTDLAWAEAVAIWPQGLAHKVSGLYDNPPQGTTLVRVPGGGIVQLLEAFRRELPLPEDDASTATG